MAVKLLCIVSDLKDTLTTSSYKVWKGGRVEGAHTNEAPVRALLRVARENGRPVTEVLMLTTPMAEQRKTYTLDGIPGESSAREYLVKSIAAFCKQEGMPEPPSATAIPCNFEHFERCLSGLLLHVQQEDEIYIDTTGGQRDAANWLVLTMQVLKYAHVRIPCVVYSVFYRNDPSANRVDQKTSQYQTLDLMQAVEEFTSCGRAEKLYSFYRSSRCEPIRLLCEKMKAFTDTLAMCRTRGMSEKISEIQEGMRALRENPPSRVGASEQLFLALIPLLEKNFISATGKGPQQMLELIRWCCKAGLGMPALALFRENFASMLTEARLIYPSKELARKMQDQHVQANLLEMILYQSTLADLYRDSRKAIQETTLRFPLKAIEFLNCNNQAEIHTSLPEPELSRMLCYYHFLWLMRNTAMHAGDRAGRLSEFERIELALPARLEDIGASTVCNIINAAMNRLENDIRQYGKA